MRHPTGRLRRFAVGGASLVLSVLTIGAWSIGSGVVPWTLANASSPSQAAAPEAVPRAMPHRPEEGLGAARRAAAGIFDPGTGRPQLTADRLYDPRVPDAPPATGQPPADPAPPASPRVRSQPAQVAWPSLSIPAIGINRSVTEYPCDRSAPPDHYVYRWGCAGANNLYLLGHASTVFKPLYDAYASGHLQVGMAAYWTDESGHVTLYRVTTWRLVVPTDSGWAIAAQPVPSMTLQTCYGANSQWRLLLRLVAS